jgi:cytochrome b6-f complex iron-sulfur subunit
MTSPAMTSDTSPRRGFLTKFMGACIAFVATTILYPVARFLNPPSISEAVQSSVVVGKITDFVANSGTLFQFGRQPGILVRLQDGEFRAYHATCTHLDCTVQYSTESRSIWCACHNGYYDLNGNNISGPPPRPLDKFTVIIHGEEVIVSQDPPAS